MIAASDPYVRVLVRVPEAYLLVRALDATRPGLLVLDADGRRVDSIAFPGMGAPPIDAATIAKRLTAAQSATAVELWRFSLKGDASAAAKLRKQVSAKAGVELSKRKTSSTELRVSKNALTPRQLTAAATKLSLTVRWQEPVPIHFPSDSTATVAGAWHLDPDIKRAFVTALLLDPKRLPEGWGTDLETRSYRLPNIPKGGTGYQVALAPMDTSGVVAIFADIFKEQQTVVGRAKTTDWGAVKRAFVRAGCQAEELPQNKK